MLRSILVVLAAASTLVGCGAKKLDPLDLHAGPAEPEAYVPLPAPQVRTPSDPVAGWRWLDLPNTVCRNGSSTGIAFEKRPNSNKLVVFMQGGNACINRGCIEQVNRSHFAESDWNNLLCEQLDDCSVDGPGQTPTDKWDNLDDEWLGVLDGHPDNPFADWNKVFIPYCSGDWHAGHNPVPTALGSAESVFMGTPNTREMLAAARDVLGTSFDKVLITGASAGGVGAIANYHRFVEVYGGQNTYLLSDAGPLFTDDHVAACVQARVKNLWRVDRGLPRIAGCPGPSCVWNQDQFMSKAWEWLLDGYARGASTGPVTGGSRMGLVVSNRDSAAVAVFEAAKKDCARIDDIYIPIFPPYAKLEAATNALRTDLFDAYHDVKIFQIDDTEHMWMWRKKWWALEFTDGTNAYRIADWVEDMLTEQPSWQHVVDVTLAPASATASSSPDMLDAIFEEGAE